jgi:nitric oxide dioxygenase
MQVLALAVTSLNRLDTILPAVRELGVKHISYGVHDAHYDTVGAALLWTLEKGLGTDFTPAVREAWTLTYTTLAGAMRDGAREAQPAAA